MRPQDSADAQLNQRVNSGWEGVQMKCPPPAEPGSSSYRAGAKSTECVLEGGGNAWLLTECREVRVYPKSRPSCVVTLCVVQTFATPLYTVKRLVLDFPFIQPDATRSAHERLQLLATAAKRAGVD